MEASPVKVETAGPSVVLKGYIQTKLDEVESDLRDKHENLRRLEAQRNELNSKGKLCGRVLEGSRMIALYAWSGQRISASVHAESNNIFSRINVNRCDRVCACVVICSEKSAGGTTAPSRTWILCG